MSYESKINSVKQVLDIHNQNASDKNKVELDVFLKNLQDMGGTTEESLSLCTWEDLEKCGLPRLIARQISQNIFRKQSSSSEDGLIYYSERKVQQMSIKQLVEAYNPKDANNAIGKRLKELSKGRRCIVFTKEDKINADATVKMIEDLSNGLPELEMAFVDGIPTMVYKVGDRLDLYADENPLYPGRALRTGEICDQTGRSWNGVALTVRQLLRIAMVETRELKITDIDQTHAALDKAVSQDAENVICSRYPKAYLKYCEFLKTNKLPILKIKLNGTNDSVKSNHPFYAENREF